MIRPLHLLPDLVGKICKLRPEAAKHITGYDKGRIAELLFFQNVHNSKMFFTFINEPPHWDKGLNQYFYCIEDSELKDWYWFPLNTLTICTD